MTPRSRGIEQRLACTCGCTLDIFTCRTTDFTCTYSPELHREVLALRDEGKTAQQILDTFVAKYGEKALMAPKAEGFNLAGYLLPGTLIAAAGAGLALFIGRRKTAVALATARPDPTAGVQASPEELDRLQARAGRNRGLMAVEALAAVALALAVLWLVLQPLLRPRPSADTGV